MYTYYCIYTTKYDIILFLVLKWNQIGIKFFKHSVAKNSDLFASENSLATSISKTMTTGMFFLYSLNFSINNSPSFINDFFF
jgi:hypothetical protein